jgi:hypothetical protein
MTSQSRIAAFPPPASAQEGLVVDPERRRVRFRRDPAGIFYELRRVPDDELTLRVVHHDEIIGSVETLGSLRRTRLGWRSDPPPGTSAARKDILRDIARTWSRLPYLAPASQR